MTVDSESRQYNHRERDKTDNCKTLYVNPEATAWETKGTCPHEGPECQQMATAFGRRERKGPSVLWCRLGRALAVGCRTFVFFTVYLLQVELQNVRQPRVPRGAQSANSHAAAR